MQKNCERKKNSNWVKCDFYGKSVHVLLFLFCGKSESRHNHFGKRKKRNFDRIFSNFLDLIIFHFIVWYVYFRSLYT